MPACSGQYFPVLIEFIIITIAKRDMQFKNRFVLQITNVAMKPKWYIGIDIGGTKSAVLLINENGEVSGRKEVSTTKGRNNWQPTLNFLIEGINEFTSLKKIAGIGVSCGGPLDTKTGIICSPPNLPGWDEVPIVNILEKKSGIPTALENDANAGALAEWRFGAGRGHKDVIFLTFGTGLGAGLILDGRLYSGASGYAGEAGHIRLSNDGPIGYGKRGSFEGFCSGTGIAQMMGFELLCLKEQAGEKEMLEKYKEPGKVTGKDVYDWAQKEDPLALKVIQKSGEHLGKGLSILIDLLNPEVVVVGSMGVRLGDLLLEPARKVVEQEALAGTQSICKIVPAVLGDKTGDFAALCVAAEAPDRSNKKFDDE